MGDQIMNCALAMRDDRLDRYRFRTNGSNYSTYLQGEVTSPHAYETEGMVKKVVG